MGSGDDLPSRAVSSQVLSACGGLTSVFGMGTGGTLQLLSPEIVYRFQGDAPGPRISAFASFGFRLRCRPLLLLLPPLLSASAFTASAFPRSVPSRSAFASRLRTLKTAQEKLTSIPRNVLPSFRYTLLPLRFASGLFSRLQIKPSTD